MPIGFTSAARNLFLLGSSGAQVVSNFFKKIDQTAGTDGVYLPDEIKYITADQKYVLAGSNETASSRGKGWIEKRTDAGTSDWKVELQSNLGTNYANLNTTLRALEIDSTGNLFAVGKTGTVPWVAKYTSNGVLTWKASSATQGLGYTGLAIDSSNNVYACGSSSTRAYVERLSGSLGVYTWGRDSRTTAGVITYNKCATNSRGEVILAGKIGDTLKDKGYISKLSTSTGDLLWERTIEDLRLGTSSSYWQTECTDVFVDSVNNIFVVGTLRDTIGSLSKGFLIKYSPEGNIIWQRETKLDRNFEYVSVKSNGLTGETIVVGRFRFSNDDFVLLNKYSQDGTLIWSRSIFSSLDQTIGNVSIDFDPSFYYFIFTDETVSSVAGEPDTYTFGKLSTSGNGLGDFQYTSLGTTFDYKYLSITDDIGRLSDGSLRQDASDFITYPHSPNKILFDDYATQIANKKVQVFAPNTYSTVRYPFATTVRATLENIVTSGLVLSLDAGRTTSYPGSGTTWTDLSGNGNTGTLVNGVGYNSNRSSLVDLDVQGFLGATVPSGTELDIPLETVSGTGFGATVSYLSNGQISYIQILNGGGGYTSGSVLRLPMGSNPTIVLGNLPDANAVLSLTFDGSNDYGYIDYSASLAPTSAISSGGWIYYSNWTTSSGNIFSKLQSGGYALQHSSVGSVVYLILRLGGAYRSSTFNKSLMNSGWNHIYGTFDGRYIQMYLNGNAVGTPYDHGSAASIEYAVNNNLAICVDAAGGSSNSVEGTTTNATISIIQIYNRALSAAEVSQNFNALRSRFGI